MMLSSRSDEFGLVHERRDETGGTDAASAPEAVEQAERARPRWARGSSLAVIAVMVEEEWNARHRYARRLNGQSGPYR
jgi:hypothetical protein